MKPPLGTKYQEHVKKFYFCSNVDSDLKVTSDIILTEVEGYKKRKKFWSTGFFIIRVQLDEFSKIKFYLTENWTQITCLAGSHTNHYTRMFSVPVWGSNWVLFMHGWFWSIRLIHLIRQKSRHLKKRLSWYLRELGILSILYCTIWLLWISRSFFFSIAEKFHRSLNSKCTD